MMIKAQPVMGGSSSKRTFFWQKKKKSPVQKAWSQLKGALPAKKRRKKSILSLDKLKPDNLRREKQSQKRFSLSADKKRLSLGNIRKGSIQTTSPGRKEDAGGGGGGGGGLGRVGQQIKRKLSQEPKRGLGSKRFSLPL